MYCFSKKILSTTIALTLVGSNFIPTFAYAANETLKDENTFNEVVQEQTSNETQEFNNNIVEEQTDWDQNAEMFIKQELKRYIKYENKTLVSFLVSSGVKENSIPLLEKTVQIYVPEINGKGPSKIIVPNKKYEYQDQILMINNKLNEKDSKDLNWDSNEDILITYIYEGQTDEDVLKTIAMVSANTIDERIINARTDEMSYNVSEQVGNLLEVNVSGDKQVNKGYLYTNVNRTENKLETKFNTKYQLNIGFKNLVDEIQIKENNVSKEVLTRKISVNKEELINLLGKEGTIKVLDNNDEELGILKEDNLELNVDSYGLKFIVSKPEVEGYININLEKVLNVNIDYTTKSISNKNDIDNSINVVGNMQCNEVSNNYIENKITLVEPSSNASINISKNVLSTVVTNENVVITATLERNDITDALYKDPELLITLPSQITGVNLKDARLIYENELVPVTFKAEGNTIYLKLEGTQTEYSSIPNVDGTVVKIVADLSLDNLAVNSDEKIILEYTNKNRDESKQVEAPIKIVAPTGFVTSNYATVDQTVSSISNDSSLLIKANDVEKQITLGGIVVSNLQENASGLLILGRFPVNETKSVDENNTDLGSTFSIKVNTPISVEGIDADIYYSDNGNATYDLSDEQNGWSLERKDTSKSYLIVSKSEVSPAQKITFNYVGTIPQNLDYANKASSIFGVYYNNEAKEGVNKNVVVSKLLSIETENIPVIKTEIIARNYNNKDAINSKDKINGGEKVEYIIRATNTGKKAAENVKIIAKRPENTAIYTNGEDYDENNQDYTYNSSELIKQVERINPGETVEFSCIASTSNLLEEKQITFRAEVTAENMEENSTASFGNTITEGTLQLNLYTVSNSAYETDEVKIGDEITYNLSMINNSTKNLKNVKVNINIPKYLELQSYDEGSYNEETRTLSYSVDEINYYKGCKFIAKVVSSDEPNQEISLVAKGSYDGAEKEVKSNTALKTVQDTKGFTATLSSNIAYKMLDTDTVEYYINVKNESKKTAKINIYNKLPEELKLVRYSVKNGNTGYTKEDPTISTSIEEELKAGENLKVTIVGKPYILDSVGQLKEIENKVDLTINGIKLDVNTVKQQIEGTSNFNTVISGEEKKESENIYSISGKVWYDENGNSAQDENEIGMTKVPLKLYNVTTKEYVKDEEGNELQIYTDDNGYYIFENLESGEYIVYSNYDDKVYKVANYQTSDLSQNENNDFIEADDKEEENGSTAVTNVITISGENVYNIDLGLIDVENFNIVLNSKISKISVVSEGNTTSYDVTNNMELNTKKLENSTLIIEYLLEVKNEGNIDGYVTQIASNITDGMQFVSELNKDWYVNNNGEAINTSLSNKLIKSGEKETLKLVLIKKVTNKNEELMQDISEIRGTYNKYGIEEVTRSNLQDSSVKSAKILINENQNESVAEIIGISVSILAIISLIGVGVYKSLNKYLKP